MSTCLVQDPRPDGEGKPWTLQIYGAVIRETIGMFGMDRCMFALNFPVDSVKASWDRIYCQFKYVTAGCRSRTAASCSPTTHSRFTGLPCRNFDFHLIPSYAILQRAAWKPPAVIQRPNHPAQGGAGDASLGAGDGSLRRGYR